VNIHRTIATRGPAFDTSFTTTAQSALVSTEEGMQRMCNLTEKLKPTWSDMPSAELVITVTTLQNDSVRFTLTGKLLSLETCGKGARCRWKDESGELRLFFYSLFAPEDKPLEELPPEGQAEEKEAGEETPNDGGFLW
jgi:hypothetical protein